VIDVAPWIAQIYLEPLQLIRSASAEPVQATMDPVYTNVCIICLDGNPPPVQCGCACRGDMGLAHIGCIIRSAEYYATRRGPKAWRECQTCKQDFTGVMKMGLTEAWGSRVAPQPSSQPSSSGSEVGFSAHVHEPPPMAQSKRAKLMKRLRIVLLVAAFACSVLLLVILGSVCITQRNYGSDVECTLCGSCAGGHRDGGFRMHGGGRAADRVLCRDRLVHDGSLTTVLQSRDGTFDSRRVELTAAWSRTQHTAPSVAAGRPCRVWHILCQYADERA
jgi:hypothetical protein